MAYRSAVPVNQLRDALLIALRNDREKRLLWKQVALLIHQNSNIRESIMMLKGEQHVVWEWIGRGATHSQDAV